MFSAHRKTILFLGSEPLFAKISLIAVLSALIACGCGCSQKRRVIPVSKLVSLPMQRSNLL